MAKTCRTCAHIVMVPRCRIHYIPVHSTMANCPADCPCWQPRETPLLVDELAEALKALDHSPEAQFAYLESRNVQAPVSRDDVVLGLHYGEDGRYVYPARNRLRTTVIKTALVRYHKEVGDEPV